MTHANEINARELGLIGDSPPMRELLRLMQRVATTQATVLILGESGTGKELVAAGIHRLSKRAERPFVTVDCTNIPANLMESEVFGHEAGAFTDARQRKEGLFELAEGGTVLLDEIGLLPMELQAKLLGVLETRRFRRLGGTVEHTVDTRFLEATNEELGQAVDEGRFREDLYHRLNVVPMEIPPLRDRGDDIFVIAKHFLGEYTERHGIGQRSLGQSAILLLRAYGWPGNVRELRNVIERAVVLTGREDIRADDLVIDRRTYRSSSTAAGVSISESGEIAVRLPAAGVSLELLEREVILAALRRVDGNVTRAATLLAMSRDTLRYRIQKHGLDD